MSSSTEKIQVWVVDHLEDGSYTTRAPGRAYMLENGIRLCMYLANGSVVTVAAAIDSLMPTERKLAYAIYDFRESNDPKPLYELFSEFAKTSDLKISGEGKRHSKLEVFMSVRDARISTWAEVAAIFKKFVSGEWSIQRSKPKPKEQMLWFLKGADREKKYRRYFERLRTEIVPLLQQSQDSNDPKESRRLFNRFKNMRAMVVYQMTAEDWGVVVSEVVERKSHYVGEVRGIGTVIQSRAEKFAAKVYGKASPQQKL